MGGPVWQSRPCKYITTDDLNFHTELPGQAKCFQFNTLLSTYCLGLE